MFTLPQKTLLALTTLIPLLGYTQGNNPIEISANVALSTEYIFRGAPQTDGEPALSGGFDFGHDSGLYLGIWASNVDFGDSASLETDYYFGWSKELQSEISVDIGVIAYTYTGGDDASDSNLSEIYIGLGWKGLNGAYHFGNGDADDYFQIDYGYDFEKVSLSAVYGYADFEESYSFYGLGVSTQLANLDIALNWTDNDTDIDDSNLVLTVSKSF